MKKYIGMRKLNVLIFCVFASNFVLGQNTFSVEKKSIYDFEVKNLSGELVDFETFKGKKNLIVNVASKCGFTPQYADLQKLHEIYGDKVQVIGFPSGDFKQQEFEKNKQIEKFCKENYGVSFLMMEKISVIGVKTHPLFVWLSNESMNGVTNQSPNWNFCKYLISEDGTIISFFDSMVNPMSETILNYIK